jgi:hypothetical protein
MLDGHELPRSTLGVALPLDPGEHRVDTEAPGGKLVQARFRIARGEKKQIDLAVSTSPRRLSTYVLGGVSLAALTAGFVAGAVTMGRAPTLRQTCPDNRCSTASDRADGNDVQRLAAVSTVSTVAGLGGLTATSLLFLTEPSASEAPSRPRQASGVLLTVHGVW